MDQLEKYQTEDDNKQDVDMKNEEEKQSRAKNYKLPEPRYTSGVLHKYSKLVKGADKGAVTG